MIYLTEEISSQENMEAWFSQLSDPAFPLKKGTILEQLKPDFVCCNFAQRTAEFVFRVQDWQLNPEGGLHGGIIVTQFDAAFGLTAHYFAKQHMLSTITINTTFLKPIRQDDVIQYKVKVTSLGNTIYNMTAEAWLKRDNILAATASTSFMKLHHVFAQPI